MFTYLLKLNKIKRMFTYRLFMSEIKIMLVWLPFAAESVQRVQLSVRASPAVTWMIALTYHGQMKNKFRCVQPYRKLDENIAEEIRKFSKRTYDVRISVKMLVLFYILTIIVI